MLLISLKSGKQVLVNGDTPFELKETARKGVLSLVDADGNGYWPEQNCIQDWAYRSKAWLDEQQRKRKEAFDADIAEKGRQKEADKKRLDEARAKAAANAAWRKKSILVRLVTKKPFPEVG